jgi:formate dehydrogenase subunit gamma
MKLQWSNRRHALAMLGLAIALAGGALASPSAALAQQVPTLAPQGGVTGTAPGIPEKAQESLAALGVDSDSDIWRAIRNGVQGGVSMQDATAGLMVQSEGDNWRNIRNGPLFDYGWKLLATTIALLAIFFAARGRIRIDGGPTGTTIERFNNLERFVHWLTAGSFIVLALTGLYMLYGRYVFGLDASGEPGSFSAGHQAFATVAYYGKLVHNFIGFSFATGIVLTFVIWAKHNFPDKYDVVWLVKAGGLLTKGVHPPAGKFNAGQKAMFWIVVLGGTTMVVSGLALVFPYQITPFAGTFAFLNIFGFDLPTQLTPLQEVQLSSVWHGAVSLILIAIIVAHIYIGTLGMEGAFDAMGTGQVDEKWARDHHSVWVTEHDGASPPDDGDDPGEAPQAAE